MRQRLKSSKCIKISVLSIFFAFSILATKSFGNSPSALAPTDKQSSLEPEVLAWVNDEPLTEKELFQSLRTRHQRRSRQTYKTKDFRKLLEQLIDDRLLVQEALRMDMDMDKAVQSELEQHQNSLARKLLVRLEVEEKVKFAEQDVKVFYEKMFERIHARQIVVETREEAEAVLKELRAGADFAQLATERSVGPAAKNGGDIGTFPRYKIFPPLEEAVFALKIDEISQPIPAEDKFHVVRIEERISADPDHFELLKPSLEARLRSELEKERKRAFVLSLKEKATVEVRSDLVEEFGLEKVHNPTAQLSEDPVATVNGAKISMGQFRLMSLQALKIKAISKGKFPKLKKLVLDKMVSDKLLEQEAEKRGLIDDPWVQERLLAEGRKILKEKFIRDVIWPQVKMTKQDLEAYYEKHKEQYRKPSRIRLARLAASSKDKAMELHEKALAGADFAWLVSQKSEDDAELIKKGGDLGWTLVTLLPSSIKEVVAELSTGAISPPVKEGGSYYIYYVLGREKGQVPPLDELMRQVQVEVSREQLQLAIEQWVSRLREESDVRYNEAKLEQMSQSQRED